MLNLVTFDIDDRQLLESSYNALKNKERMVIVTDDHEKKSVFRKMVDVIRKPGHSEFSLQNLFKLHGPYGYFYIAQCLVDFGYPAGPKSSQTFTHQYYYQLVGIAFLSVDLGITHMRRETKADKILGLLFSGDIDFEGAEKFNDKYYLVSDKKQAVLQHFDPAFLQAVAKYDDLLLTTNGRELYISFESALSNNQSRHIQDILNYFKYLEQPLA